MLPTKQCTKCKKIKQLSEFHKQKTHMTGHRSICKTCIFIVGKVYRDRNKELIATKKKNYRDNNKEIVAEKKKIYYEANKEKLSEYKKQYQINNKDMISIKAKKYYAENRESIKARVLKYRELKINKIQSYMKSDARKASWKNSAHKRRSIRHNGDVTTKQILNLQDSVFVCRYCNCIFSKELIKTVDHIIPLARGGLHTFSNLQIICRDCNSSKNARDPQEFALSRGMLL